MGSDVSLLQELGAPAWQSVPPTLLYSGGRVPVRRRAAKKLMSVEMEQVGWTQETLWRENLQLLVADLVESEKIPKKMLKFKSCYNKHMPYWLARMEKSDKRGAYFANWEIPQL